MSQEPSLRQSGRFVRRALTPYRREFVRDLSYAKDIQDMFRIQMEFIQAQMSAFGEQAKSLGEAYIKAASGQTRKPPE